MYKLTCWKILNLLSRVTERWWSLIFILSLLLKCVTHHPWMLVSSLSKEKGDVFTTITSLIPPCNSFADGGELHVDHTCASRTSYVPLSSSSTPSLSTTSSTISLPKTPHEEVCDEGKSEEELISILLPLCCEWWSSGGEDETKQDQTRDSWRCNEGWEWCWEGICWFWVWWMMVDGGGCVWLHNGQRWFGIVNLGCWWLMLMSSTRP